jgi:integrase
VASIEKRVRAGRRTAWRARYRTPSGDQRNKSFARKVDAERFLASVESAKTLGSFVDPAMARLTMGTWATHWLENQTHLKASTKERYAGILREHIRPKWDGVQLANVAHADVQSWVTSLSRTRSPATVRKVHRVLSLILDMAVKDGRLSRNVASGVNLPRPVKAEQRYLTHSQVEELAAECGRPSEVSKHRRLDERSNETYRLVVLFLSYTGVRFGELAALQVRRLDLVRRRALITQSVTVVQGQGLVWGTPKTHERREVPIPRFLVDDLAAHVSGKDPEDLVFPGVRRGGVLRVAVFRYGAFDAAAAAIGEPGLHPHELRHTAASLAIASGADVKVVQQKLGHSSATMTMDTYGHLFENRLDDIAEALDAARTAARSAAPKTPDPAVTADAVIAPAGSRVPPVCPPTNLIDLAEVRAKGKTPGQRRNSKGAPGRIRTYATASGGRCSIP